MPLNCSLALSKLNLTPLSSYFNQIMNTIRPLTKYLIELGVSNRLTCFHTSHQNVTAQRKHIYIVEIGLSLLSHSSTQVLGSYIFYLGGYYQ